MRIEGNAATLQAVSIEQGGDAAALIETLSAMLIDLMADALRQGSALSIRRLQTLRDEAGLQASLRSQLNELPMDSDLLFGGEYVHLSNLMGPKHESGNLAGDLEKLGINLNVKAAYRHEARAVSDGRSEIAFSGYSTQNTHTYLDQLANQPGSGVEVRYSYTLLGNYKIYDLFDESGAKYLELSVQQNWLRDTIVERADLEAALAALDASTYQTSVEISEGLARLGVAGDRLQEMIEYSEGYLGSGRDARDRQGEAQMDGRVSTVIDQILRRSEERRRRDAIS